MKRIVLLLALALIVTIAPAAMAQSDLGLKGLGVAVGFVSPENMDGVFSFGGFANLGNVTPNIGLEARLDYWSWSKSEFGVETKAHDTALGVRGKYYFDVQNAKFKPFAGAGLAFHFIGAEVDMPASGGFPATSTSDSETKLGLDLGGGLLTPINPRVDFLGEVWYGVVSDVNQFSMRAGISYKLGS
jgi:opacity protein-like surface antigen